MPYTVENPPGWLKNLPEGAVRMGVEAFNAAMAETEDEERARIAAWSAVKTKYEKGDDGTWRLTQEMSLDELRQQIAEALTAREGESAWLREVYGTYVVFEKDGRNYRLSLFLEDGKPRFEGDPLEVEQTWIERTSQEEAETESLYVRLVQAVDPEGAAWEVVICESGFTKNGWYLPEEVLRQSEKMFEGIDVNLYELPGRAGHIPEPLFTVKDLLIKNKAGWLDTVRFVAGEGLKGVLHFLDSHKWLGRNLMDAMRRGAQVYGLSWDAIAMGGMPENVKGRMARVLKRFGEVDSLDLVSRPAAGGKFIRAVAARDQGEDIMTREEILGIIKERRPDLLQGKDVDKLTDQDVAGIFRMSMEPPAGPGGGAAGGDEGTWVPRGEYDLFRCGQVLETALHGSGLPEHAQRRIRSLFKSRIFEESELNSAISDEKDYLARVYQSEEGQAAVAASQVGGRVGVGIGSVEKAQIAFDKLFGLNQEELRAHARMETLSGLPFFNDRDPWGRDIVRMASDYDEFDAVPRFRGIREAYEFYTGDRDVTGFMNRRNLPPALRLGMEITSSTFTYALANTLARRLVKIYRELDYKTNLLISIAKSVADFRQQEAVLVGGFPDIETVDPESGDYQEIATVTDEESTYTVGQKGNLLTFNRKMIINDDVDLMRRLLDGFARAYARTHGKYVWGLFINNGTCSDGTAWFTSGHGNLGASALSHSTALIAYTALAKMTEKDSGERVGIVDGSFKMNLVGPVDIMNLMSRVASEEFYYSSNDLTAKLPNPLYGKVQDHVIPLLTDTDDWGLLLPPTQIDMIEMGYLGGRQEPEYFVADSPQSEQVFVADKIRHKGRHEYAGTVIDCRSGYKAAV
ncbi:MAG: ChaB family protein [Deltaproteobacteria bacterium]|nr:ChaB family protein [Deltaproteobacteria bacterium]